MNVTREHLPGLRLALEIADTVVSDSISVSELKRLIAEAELSEDEGCPNRAEDPDQRS